MTGFVPDSDMVLTLGWLHAQPALLTVGTAISNWIMSSFFR